MADSETQPQEAPRRRTAALLFGGAMMAILIIVVAVIALGGGDEEPAEEAASVVCEPVEGDGGTEECPTEVVTEPADVAVTTSEGDFTITLDVEASPATTTSFRTLVENGFYDGLNFHRVVPDFVIQGGDPFGDDPQKAGSGGPGYYVDEEVPEGTVYEPGTVAMAKTATDPSGRSGSQFFVVSGPGGQQLPPEYAFVGTVSSGMETVDAIDALGRGDGPPSRPVTIESMTLAPASA